MNHLSIKAAIVTAGTSQAAIAAFLGVTPTSVSRVIAGSMRSRRIETELEKLVGRGHFPPTRRRGRQKTVWNGKVAKAVNA